MSKPRYPTRIQPTRLNAKQRIHALLRQDSSLTPRQLALAVGCTTAYARVWKKNFFATPYPLETDESLAHSSAS
jgi:hypothetical protein